MNYSYEFYFENIEDVEQEFSIEDYQEQIETNGYLNAIKIA